MAGSVLTTVEAIELKLDEVGWEVAGRKIELIKEDHGSDPVKAVDKARKLVEHDKVDVILGPMLSSAGLAVANYLMESRTPNLAVHCHPSEILKYSVGNYFLWPGTQEGLGYPLGLYAYDKLGYRTATLMYIDYVTGQTLTQGFADAFESRGGTIVQKQAFPFGTMDFAAYLTAMKEADCCVFWAMEEYNPPFHTQYRDYGLKAPIVMPLCGPSHEITLAEIGDISLGMVGSDFYSALIDTDINKRFVDAFYGKYGYYPRGETVGGYTGTTLFLEAVKATGGDTRHALINDALRLFEVDTVAGPVSFTPEGLPAGNLYILEVIKIGDRYAWEVVQTYAK